MRADAPFVDRGVGDEAPALALAERAADELGAPRPVLLRVAMNATYAAGDLVVRVGRPTVDTRRAYDLANWLLAAGIRVPRPAAGAIAWHDETAGLSATAWERVSMAGSVDWSNVGGMVARLQRRSADEVPEGYPVPLAASFPWWQFDDLLDRVRPSVDRVALTAIAATVARHAAWITESGGPSRWVLCHGDVHPHNVVAGPDGPVLLDWDLLCLAPAGWDHAPLRSTVARWGADPAWYRQFAAGYGADLSADAVTDALTALRLVAATLMRVLAEGPNRRPDSEAERRLQWWRGDPDAPTWTVV